MIAGDPVVPFAIERKLRARYTLLGVHNIVLFAMSGIDMAAWDALGQSLNQPLARVLGGAPRPIPAYNSNGLGLLPLKELEREASELVEEGFRAVKLRVGRATAAEDIEALRVVKTAIGPGVTLMVDFNQALTVAEAVRRGRMIDDEGGVLWIEEPVRADDFAGNARVAREVATPDPDRRELHGPRADGASTRGGRLRLCHARCRAHRRGHRLDARRGARAGGRRGDVEPSLPGGERAASSRDADHALAGIRRLGRGHPRGAFGVAGRQGGGFRQTGDRA